MKKLNTCPSNWPFVDLTGKMTCLYSLQCFWVPILSGVVVFHPLYSFFLAGPYVVPSHDSGIQAFRQSPKEEIAFPRYYSYLHTDENIVRDPFTGWSGRYAMEKKQAFSSVQ